MKIVITTKETPSEKQIDIVLDFTKNGSKFKDTKFLYDCDNESIYAVCDDGLVKITEDYCQSMVGEVIYQK